MCVVFVLVLAERMLHALARAIEGIQPIGIHSTYSRGFFTCSLHSPGVVVIVLLVCGGFLKTHLSEFTLTLKPF